MGTLAVFSVEGQQIHPKRGDEFSSRYAAYVGNVRLRVDLDEADPVLEAYVRVRTEERKEQVYVRYVGDRPTTLFSDCRRAVQRELVDGRGWEFSQRSHTNPSKLFTDLVLQPSDPATPSLDGTILSAEAELVRDVLDAGEHRLTVHARNYTYLGGLVSKYARPGRSIVVAENPRSRIDASLLLLHSSEFGNLGVPDETVETLHAVRERRSRDRRRRQYDQIQAAFAELAAQDVDATTVADELQPRIRNHFDGLRLETVQGRRQAAPDLKDDDAMTPGNAGTGLTTRGLRLLASPLAAVPLRSVGGDVSGYGVSVRKIASKRVWYVVAVVVVLTVVVILIVYLADLLPQGLPLPF